MQVKSKKFNSLLPVLGTFAVCFTAVTASAQQLPVNLRSTSTFAVLGGTTVTFTGGGTVTGNIGLSPGSLFVPGSPAITVNGTVYVNDPPAVQAQADLALAINDAEGRQNPTVLLPGNIGGQTLGPGVYKSATSLAISSGDLTLDGQGNPNAVFIFQMGTTFTMTGSRQVFLVGGANANNVFWQVGSSATLDAGAVLHGTILASVSISVLAGATVDGRLLAQAAVTFTTGGANSVTLPSAPPSQFVPVTPCRVVDTRNPTGSFGGPYIAGQTSRSFAIPSGSCGIPGSAMAYSLNVAVVPRGSATNLTAWPSGQLQPSITVLTSDGRVKSNAAIIPAGTDGAVSVFVTHDADVVLDINGYFAPLNTTGELTFYPLPPCRISDTRYVNGPLGGPFLAGQTPRAIPILSSSCGVPSGALAYSLNLAVVPHVPLGYLTVWPTGSSQPYVASLNAPTGTVTSNAAIVPAGTAGSISVFASNNTDLVIDINGYFAAPGTGGLQLYNVTPCQQLDTALPVGAMPFSGPINVDIVPATCGVPSTAQAYVFGAIATPQGPLGYLTLWPEADLQPFIATLNASDGAITSNMAIVTSTNSTVGAFASNPTYLVLNVFGYFAPAYIPE